MKISFNRHAERKRLQPAASIFFITDYIFDGWYCESDEEPYPVTSQTLLTSNITLRARWKNGKYIISFNANGGENAPSSITFNPGQSFTVPDQQPRRFGYTFEGWSTNAESTSGSYYPGKTVTPSSSMTLYAAWKSAGEITYGADEYRIYDCTFPERHIWYAFTPDETTSYFFRAAGEPDEKAVSVLSGKNSYLIPSRYITDASRIYAEFALTAGKTYYIQLDIVGVRGESGSLMIYKGHPVSYHMGSSNETDYCYDDQEDFRLRNGVTKAHTFQLNENYTGGSVSTISRTDSVQSWNTSSALTGTSYAPGSTQRFTRAVTLYPQWSKAAFGTLPTPSRSGYTFEGWYTAQTGGTRITSSMLAADYISSAPTLYAHWSANIQEITIRFNSNGGDQTYVPMVYEAGSNLSLPTPTRSGYTFDGWYTAETGGTRVTSSTPFNKDTVLWAHWTQDIVYITVSFDCNGGGQIFNPQKIPTGSIVSLPAPTRTGYKFMGWYTAQTGGTRVNDSTTFTADTTLWAHWSMDIVFVLISFDGNGNNQSFTTLSVESGASVPLPAPTRSGYTFDGWYTERTGGVKVTEETTFHQDTTLYAHWIFGTWESTPALDLPVLEEDCVILTWYSAVPAQAYSVYELGEDNTLLFKAKVTACRAEIRNILPGAHTYIVMPTQQNANGVWQYGKPSNQVTIQYAGNQPLTLPAALSRLEASAFEENNAIYEVKFTGNRVTAIGDYAFRNCKNLLKITIPDSVTSFGRGIFDGCGKLVVYCSEGSAAQAYCESNQLAYKLLPN